MNRRRRRTVRHTTGAMHSDMPSLEGGDIGLLRWIAASLRVLARQIEAIARRDRS